MSKMKSLLYNRGYCRYAVLHRCCFAQILGNRFFALQETQNCSVAETSGNSSRYCSRENSLNTVGATQQRRFFGSFPEASKVKLTNHESFSSGKHQNSKLESTSSQEIEHVDHGSEFIQSRTLPNNPTRCIQSVELHNNSTLVSDKIGVDESNVCGFNRCATSSGAAAPVDNTRDNGTVTNVNVSSGNSDNSVDSAARVLLRSFSDSTSLPELLSKKDEINTRDDSAEPVAAKAAEAIPAAVAETEITEAEVATAETIAEPLHVTRQDDSGGTSENICTAKVQEKLLVVLDVDETLVFSHINAEAPYDAEFIHGVDHYYVAVRPGAKEFLKWCHKMDFEIGVYTTSTPEYLAAILRLLDPEGALVPSSRWRSRSDCIEVKRKLQVAGKTLLQLSYTKDLRCFRPSLERAVLVDDSLLSFIVHPDNGIPVTGFRGNLEPQQPATLVSESVASEPRADLPVVEPNDTIPKSEDSSLTEPDEDITFAQLRGLLSDLKDVADVRTVLRPKFNVVGVIFERCVDGIIGKATEDQRQENHSLTAS